MFCPINFTFASAAKRGFK